MKVINISFEDFKKLTELLAKYLEKGEIRVIDERGRVVVGKELKGKYLLLTVLKHQSKYLIVGILKEPEELAKDILK